MQSLLHRDRKEVRLHGAVDREWVFTERQTWVPIPAPRLLAVASASNEVSVSSPGRTALVIRDGVLDAPGTVLGTGPQLLLGDRHRVTYICPLT